MSSGFTTLADQSSFRYRLGSDPAWHRFGNPYTEANPSAREAVRQSGLDFPTILAPVYAEIPGSILQSSGLALDEAGNIVQTPARIGESTRVALPEHFAHVRPDNGQIYGLVSPRFDIVENAHVAEFADALREDDPSLRVEASFGLYDLSTLCLTLSRGDVIDPNRGTGRPEDPVLPYLSLSNGHGGTRVFSVIPTTIRVVCANTLAMAESAAGSKSIRFRHTRSAATGIGMADKLKQARTVLASAARLQAQFAEKVQALARRPMTTDETREWLAQVYAECFGTEPARDTIGEEMLAKWLEKRRDILTAWTRNLDDARQSTIRGTAWGALNAVTQWCDHERGRFNAESDGTFERRLESNLFGASATDKGKAFRRALALV